MHRLLLVVVSLVGAVAGCGFPAADGNGDGDSPNGVGFLFPSSVTDETVGTHSVAIALSRPATDLVTVDVEVVETGTADGNDFSLIGGQISFPVGADRADVDIRIDDDGNDDEDDETIELRLVNASNATLSHDSHEVTISNTPLPRFSWEEPTSTGGEGDGAQTFRIVFTRALPIETQIGVGQSGTAGAADYTLAETTLVVPVGSVEFPVEIAVDDENIDEYDEVAALTLSAITGAILDPESNGVHEHTIVDDDEPPIAAFQLTTDTQGEGAGTKQIVVTLTPQSGKTVTFGFTDTTATSGTASAADYAIGTASPLTFNPGDTQKMIAVTPTADALYEDDELIALALSGLDPETATPSASNASTALTIDDDDPMPSIQFQATTSTATEGATDNVVIALSAVSGKPVTFTPTNTAGSATAGDYSFSTSPVTIAAGAATSTLAVAITNDTLAEGNETFQIGLTALSGATLGANATHTATISANDPCTVSWDPTEADGSEPEGDPAPPTLSDDYVYEIVLSNPSATAVTVVVTRTGGASDTDADILPDIPAGGNATITFAAGDTVEPVTVRVSRDDMNESNSGDPVILTLSSPTGCTLGTTTVRTHTIEDDDGG